MFYSVDYPNEESVILKAHETFVDNDLRIKFLKEHFLEKITDSKDGWETLWKDRKDGRLWEESRAFSNVHGGGYQLLHNIPEGTAKIKYNA